MSAQSEAYKCKACGVVVAVLAGGKRKLVNCNQKMVEATPDEAKN